ncbi:hypothetical protein [Aminobacter sp. LjRoot7]|uniref:hypothetical protein n=1 Tax=Aminobacter sp. LjRoot7 TaxID=3342335 RepID=UPI003ECC3514
MRIAALVTALAMLSATTAHAACPIELAVYGDRDGAAEIDFRPTLESATVTNSFKMVMDNSIVLDGVVMWSQDVARPNGMLMHQCPEGDVTGEEIEACTVWQGVIYSVDEQGNVGLLPRERIAAAAPKKLIFSDLGHGLRSSAAYGPDGFSKVPWDVFELKGCQE